MSKEDTPSAPPVSHGVEELIARLKDQGVTAGRDEAGRLIADAKAEAARIVGDARREADAALAQARSDIEAENSAATAALDLARRNALISMGDLFAEDVARRLEHMVSEAMDDNDFLRRMLLALAGRAGTALPENLSADIELASRLFDEPDDATPDVDDPVRPFLLNLARDMLREGVTLTPGGSGSGFRLTMKDKDIAVDFSEEALAALLARHLTPRFRRLFRGLE